MISRIVAVADFIVSSRAALGDTDATRTICKQHTDHLASVLRSTPVSIDEASAIFKYLSVDAPPALKDAFSDEDRTMLAAAVVTSDTTSMPAHGAVAARAQQQTHYYMHKYLVASDWTVLLNSSSPHEKLLTIIKRALSIGLTHPSELTVVALVAIITASSRAPFSPDAVHNMVLEYKRLNKSHRTGVAQTCRNFPQSPDDFVKDFPNVYTPDNLPQQCPIDDGQIERERSGMAARKTHRSLSQSSSGGVASSSVSSMITSLAAAITGSLALRQQQPHITLLSSKDASRSPNFRPACDASACESPLPAIMDRPRSDGSSQSLHGEPPCQSSPLSTPSCKPKRVDALQSVDDVLGELAGVIGCRRAADEHEPKEKAVVAPTTDSRVLMKRPAAAAATDRGAQMKRPAAFDGKKPSLAVISTRKCVTARTGIPGPGQTKSVTYAGDDHHSAMATARAWLLNRCREQGIDVPGDI